ncbi:biopolymer transport protein ExbD [Sphingomonas sp. SORGH_AS 950]|uniref:ExbD/TolR family protein n=1 Tax=unclassified Sphingomonas TaxID=196159 RepID=UPI00278776E2|nr:MULTISPECIES: biopolymer transporter ExbD [unclassified Sphingomonas]MDQ1157041.1 biopolymer transport protein ExbD [Sphingomonas sp. SORGH_AS_0950]MDR6115104.1 biopolymer transport protein ExbD [Sphingomonas sp. SORGH_AS_0789]MDR6147437.1 biopolymer transport protein ExbD [Sphingomonas sp. SORGH_AS_0870]MDR6151222.1 biopolymer transport protein ExbD [Sphingomonas sp. SORGH_AS_0742]
MAMSAGSDDGEPMMDMNTTPLIDVMLVLLIMFIITIPIQTHAVKVDLPVNSKNNTPVVNSEKNKVGIDAAGTVTWNGTPVDEVTLRQYLDQTAAMNPEPELHFQPAPDAKYVKVDEILAVIKRSAVSKLGFIGNEQYRNDF